jgi:hypothetical protein
MTTDNVRYVRPAGEPVRAGNGAPDGQKAAESERYVMSPEVGELWEELIRRARHGAHCYDEDLTLVCGWPELHHGRKGAHL